MLFRLSRGRREARRLSHWMRPDPGRYRCHQGGGKENEVQERPEINLLLAQVPHSPRVENGQTKGARRDRQLAPPTEQEQLIPDARAGRGQTDYSKRREQGEGVLGSGPCDQLRRAPDFPGEWENLVRRKTKIDVAQGEAVQEEGEKDEKENRADEREPADGKLRAAKKLETPGQP